AQVRETESAVLVGQQRRSYVGVLLTGTDFRGLNHCSCRVFYAPTDASVLNGLLRGRGKRARCQERNAHKKLQAHDVLSSFLLDDPIEARIGLAEGRRRSLEESEFNAGPAPCQMGIARQRQFRQEGERQGAV